ncbi:MAG: RNA polymerase factor sigma-54 [Bacteroidales bacterium]|jgi:RNA polymerase sigma-54 factor|nr:RNA polymerase factor sigma-54 [Bacteroidales bacterium]MBQ5401671.1 RNA polymerase factor sigma-54 [Bacteroidales bacterium]MBQ6082205.1 RNA polymerase factor sigma-54 [Bacteroidales bacterium]MBQ7457593.1 RNA polymerase factor sigma-54 [Bacteroidales bacterium]
MAKQGLSQELRQTQRLSPLQIQTIKLLELPTLELERRVQQELEENPVLDEAVDEEKDPEDDSPKNVSLSEYGNSDPTPSYKLYVNNQGKDEKPQYNTFSVKESLQQSLENQLGYCQLDERSMQIARFMIGMLEEDGYLRRDLESLSDDILFKLGIETNEEELEGILKVIQGFEPVGIAARDLQECLLLQLDVDNPTESQANARRIVEECFDALAKKHYSKISQKLNITEEQLKSAIDEIVRLNPKPGGQIDDTYSDQAQQIVPDFILELKDGVPVITMPRFNIPELRVNKNYAELLMQAASQSSRQEKEAISFVKSKLNSAKWFVEAIKQRQKTLQNTMNAIVAFQYDYFIDGDETKLKPMVLKNIADSTGLDISTISRVVNCKYVQTHFGIYPLKYFFSEGLVTKSGEEASTREIKAILTESIDSEDKHKPMTDEQLVDLLSAKGYNVARRTVAKYREQLKIPIARLRKQI